MQPIPYLGKHQLSRSLLNFITTAAFTKMESVELVTDQLEKPLTDNRTYCVIRLPNDLEALLVHDPSTDEAGACMDIDVGSMSDELPGTAHALEHVSSIPGS